MSHSVFSEIGARADNTESNKAYSRPNSALSQAAEAGACAARCNLQQGRAAALDSLSGAGDGVNKDLPLRSVLLFVAAIFVILAALHFLKW
jgi:hypothetical protein